MDWSAKIFSYCERGLDPGFWAEPLNALSNAAFLIAAAVAFTNWRCARDQGRMTVELLLVLLVAVIGIGSFLFHTFATRWAVLADVLPITIFMIAYLTYALVRFVRLPWSACALMLALFVASLWGMENLRCGQGACLNGSAGYLPALAALALIGGWLSWKGHSAGKPILIGAAVFLGSLTFRTLDREICPATAIMNIRTGTHWIWHVANATLLYILLVAAIRHRGALSAPVSKG
jgi:hypothetical protein